MRLWSLLLVACGGVASPTPSLVQGPPGPDFCGDAMVSLGSPAHWEVRDVTPGDRVVLLRGDPGQTCLRPLQGQCLDLDNPMLVTEAVAGPDGIANFDLPIPNNSNLLGRVIRLQAVAIGSAGLVPTRSIEYTIGQPTPDAACEAGPQVCDPANPGVCECSDQPGFTTYTWEVEGQQRCFTVYVPPATEPLSTVIAMNCYAANALGGGGCVPNSPMVRTANQLGFAAVCASATDGNWQFGNDGVINAANPTPCAEDDSKDIVYMQGIFDILEDLAIDGVLDPDMVFTSGFSQNSMFAAYVGVCFDEEIRGVWQGGSGLYVDGVTQPLPRSEGACSASDFETYGPSCRMLAPCTDCEFFPVYPVATPEPHQHCIMAYEDDFLSETAEPMYDALIAEGHDATLLQFPDIGRGHAAAYEEWPWIASCLEVTPTCSSTCEQSFETCMGAGGSVQANLMNYRQCYDFARYGSLSGCSRGCTPTMGMLRLMEQPCIVDGQCDATETAASCPLDCAP